MPYVRARLAPASKEYAQRRAGRNRVLLPPGPPDPGAWFTAAFDWFRAAAAYAQRRSYRSPEIARWAQERRAEILASAALVLAQSADEMDLAIPPPRQRVRRLELRQACERAPDPARAEAARQRFLFLAAQARRETGSAAAEVAAIQGRAAAWFAERAEEMDADDYGE